jgi:hypothetical protein
MPTIGISPFVPTTADRIERRNPKEPVLDKDGKRVGTQDEVQGEVERRLDDVEDAVPPMAPNK